MGLRTAVDRAARHERPNPTRPSRHHHVAVGASLGGRATVAGLVLLLAAQSMMVLRPGAG